MAIGKSSLHSLTRKNIRLSALIIVDAMRIGLRPSGVPAVDESSPELFNDIIVLS